ncbi:hypothetical protein NW760_007447 [Fusarium oxysporum]|nr:hypothetical protein NW769_000139 [Fusarium oxysporum]KAJ4229595.1 hypothetical protein NW760_007447 [Fusarium oxysporum]
MDFGLSFGSVGDFITIALLIKDIVAALDDCRGSAKQYRDLVQRLNTLHQTLEAVQQVYEDPQLTQSLEGLSKIALSAVGQIRSCLEAFLGHIRKYEPSLGNSVSGGGNALKDIRRKVQWKLNEKEVEKFCDEVVGCTMTLKMLLEVTTMRVLQRNHDTLIRERSDGEIRTAAMVHQSAASIKGYLGLLGRRIITKLDLVSQLGASLKRSTGHIIDMMTAITGDLSSIRTVIMRLDRGPSDEHFVLEDITGRTFPIHLKTITSWEVFEFILNQRFKGKKGARRVQRKLYSLQEDITHREVDWSMPWESAFLPYQRVNMSLMCKEAEAEITGEKAGSSCPFCHTPSDGETGVEVECQKCQRFFTRVVEVDNDASLPSAPTALHGETSFSVRLKRRRGPENADCEDIETCDKCHQPKRRKAQMGPKRKRGSSGSDSDSDDGDVQGLVRVHIISKRRRTGKPQVPFQAVQVESFDQLAKRFPGQSSVGGGYTERIEQGSHSKTDTAQPSHSGSTTYIEFETLAQSELGAYGTTTTKTLSLTKNQSISQSTTKDPSDKNNAGQIKIDKVKYMKKHGISASSSLKHWDPEEEPVLLFGSVFDANSIGKWIYDWTVHIYGPGTPVPEIAGDLWLLLIQLAGKTKRANETVIKIRNIEKRELVECFVEGGERLAGKFQSLLKLCEGHVLKARKYRRLVDKSIPKFGEKEATELVEMLFSPNHEFEKMAKFMQGARLFNLRFDANCEEIFRNPEA